MAKVREEAEKKSFVQKLFYPLQIKIPVQIFATVCIAVLAVYIYRSGEDRMKEVVPSSAPAPVVEVQKSQLPEQKLRTSTDEDIQKEEQLTQTNVTQRESVTTTLSDAARDVKQQDAKGIKADKYESTPTAESVALPEPALEKKKEENVMGAAMKASRAPQAQSPMIKSNILLKVFDIDTAMEETKILLVKYDAKNITRQMKQDKTIMTAQLKNQKIKDFIKQLNKIGSIEESILPVADAEGNVSIAVEFFE